MKGKKSIIVITGFIFLLFSMAAVAEDELTASHQAGAYIAGQKIEIRNTIEYTGNLTAIGLRIILPEGWTYASFYSEYMPEIKPVEGSGGPLELAWIKPPASPINFTYEVSTPASGTAKKEIQSTVIYRRMGAELTKAVNPDPLLINNE